MHQFEIMPANDVKLLPASQDAAPVSSARGGCWGAAVVALGLAFTFVWIVLVGYGLFNLVGLAI